MLQQIETVVLSFLQIPHRHVVSLRKFVMDTWLHDRGCDIVWIESRTIPLLSKYVYTTANCMTFFTPLGISSRKLCVVHVWLVWHKWNCKFIPFIAACKLGANYVMAFIIIIPNYSWSQSAAKWYMYHAWIQLYVNYNYSFQYYLSTGVLYLCESRFLYRSWCGTIIIIVML